MSRTRSAFLGTISSQLFMVLMLLLTLVTTPLVLKFLNKEEFGFSSVLFQIVAYLSLFDFGLGSAIARFLALSRGEENESQIATNQIVSTGFFAFLLLGLLVIFIAIIFAPLIPDIFKMDSSLKGVAISTVRALGVFVGIQFSLRVFNSIFYAHQRQLLANITSFIAGLLNLILPIGFLILDQGLWSFVYSFVISTLISIAITIWLIKKYYPKLKIKFEYFDKSLLRNFFNYGFFIFLNGVAVQVVFYTDHIIIGTLASLSLVTIFTLTSKIPEICRNLIFKITDSTFPAMVEINAKEGLVKFRIIHQKLMLITTCFLGICFWSCIILNESFINLWVGESYFAGMPVLILCLILMIQHGVLHVSALCLNGAGLIKGFSLVSIIEAILNVALSIYLGKLFGINGILLATILAGCITSAWYIPYTAIHFLSLNLKEYFLKPIIIPFFAIGGFGILLYVVNKFIFTIVELNWGTFIFYSNIYLLLLFLFTWIFFLKKEVSSYLPIKFKEFLRLG